MNQYFSGWRCILMVIALLPLCAESKTVLITGANSGIGLEFARQYAADGWQVIATHRRDGIPRSLADLSTEFDNVQVESLDVTNHDSIDRLATKLHGTPIDVLLNNAGLVGELTDPAQKFGSLDYALLERHLRTNTIGPLKMAEAFYDLVKASDERKIVGISSIAASLESAARNEGATVGISFRYAYNVSKAALNMAYVGLANDSRRDGVSVGLLHPGLVRVARTEAYSMTPQMEALMLDVDVAVRRMRGIIADLDIDSSGSFVGPDGQAIAW